MTRVTGTSQRVVVAGMVAGDAHQGGATWAALQYVLGLQALGHDVLVVEPLPCGPIGAEVTAYFDAVCTRFQLCGRAVLLPSGGEPHGMKASCLAAFIDTATVLVNLSGRWRDRERVGHIDARVYVDLDPGFTQIWHEQGVDVGLDGHTHHVTVGGRVGGPDTSVPTCDVTWRPMLPPVVLDRWPVCPAPPTVGLGTVANWRSYGSVEHDGIHFGQKAHAFRALAGLPAALHVPIAVALSIDPGDDADRQRLVDAGWRLINPLLAAGDPDRYQRFVRSSAVELGVAKTGYVNGRTGWVSDRSACYLASGRPVVLQDTGLDGVLPLGDGVVTFSGVDDAVAVIDDVVGDYARHARAARAIAVEHLDARRVLGDLMASVGA